jgi:IS5 family transposase
MQPKRQERGAFELSQAHFDQLLNPNHELVQLARRIDWAQFDVALADCFSPDMGAPAKATQLMVGLHYFKYAFNESLVERWVENPYWQYFCGFTRLQHECPIHPTSMTKWRNRVGADRLQSLLQETIALGRREGFIRP